MLECNDKIGWDKQDIHGKEKPIYRGVIEIIIYTAREIIVIKIKNFFFIFLTYKGSNEKRKKN